MTQAFDLVVVGTGVAASQVATRCRKAGWSVAIIDERPFGGTCALRGCDPKKVLRRGAEVVDAARCMVGKGVELGGLRIDWPALQTFKRGFTDPVPAQRERSFAEAGIATFHGTARFLDRNTLAVGDTELRGKRIVIATGMKPRPLGIPGEELVTTSDGFLDLETLPRRVLFIGGGYISFEFAHMAARADAEVVVLNRGPKPLAAFDPDLVEMLLDRSRSVGITFYPNAEVEAVERNENGLSVRAAVAGGTERFGADLVVHGAGRVPAVDELDLEKADLKAGKRGIEVNAYLQSPTNPAVYAAGDAASGGPQMTPVASLEGKVVAANLLEGNHVVSDYTGIPCVVFTIPALARVGLQEEKAREQGLDLSCRLTDMRGWYSARRVGETHAAAKLLIENGTGRILGAHLLGPESSELINLFGLAMRSGLTAEDLKDLGGAYPSAASDLSSLL